MHENSCVWAAARLLSLLCGAVASLQQMDLPAGQLKHLLAEGIFAASSERQRLLDSCQQQAPARGQTNCSQCHVGIAVLPGTAAVDEDVIQDVKVPCDLAHHPA